MTIEEHAACPFCEPGKPLLANQVAYVRFDKHPVSPGHCLILPFRHVANFFEATRGEMLALLDLLEEAKELLDRKYRPDGYNIGINVNGCAGQTVMHLHIHLIPRYRDDMSDPRGGVRGVIPGKQKYPAAS